MECYLVRHGDALSEAQDSRRPLTDRGRKSVERVVVAAPRKVQVSAILHSGKLRAQQTAEIIAGAIGPGVLVRESGGLLPDDDPMIARAEIEASKSPLMLVGHLPHLGRLASLLVRGDPERENISFSPAMILCLARQNSLWAVRWSLAPEAL